MVYGNHLLVDCQKMFITTYKYIFYILYFIFMFYLNNLFHPPR